MAFAKYSDDQPRAENGQFGEGTGTKSDAVAEKAKETADYFKADKAKLERIRDYTDSRAKDGYRSINQSLRAGKPTEGAQKLIEDTKDAPKFSGEVHRAALVPKEYAQELKDLAGAPGTAVKATSFWSSSRDEKVARSFASPSDKKEGQARVLMHIQTNSGVAIESISRIKGEQEVLIRPGTRFSVTKAERKGDVLHVTLKEKAAA